MLPNWISKRIAVSLLNQASCTSPTRVSATQVRHARGDAQRRLVLGGIVLVAIIVIWFVPLMPTPGSPYAVSPRQFPTGKDADILGFLPSPLKPKRWGMRVPNAVHYVYGLKPVPEGETAPPLPYYAYLGMRSALLNLRPEKIYFHYKHKPTGPWWDLIEPHLTLIKTNVPSTIYGREVSHFAHKADLVRLWVLKRMGGIYLDIDMYVIKDFDDLLYASATMGMEASPDSRRTVLQPTGLCNGVIISEANAPFIQNWLKTYVTFHEENWAGHSVDKPWELAQLFPNDIQVLNTTAMFWPLWSGQEIDIVHQENKYDFYGTGQYSYHAWESLAMKYLTALNPRDINRHDTSFHRLVRPFVGPTDEEVYRKLQ